MEYFLMVVMPAIGAGVVIGVLIYECWRNK